MSDTEIKDSGDILKKDNLPISDASRVVPHDDDDSFTHLPEGRISKKRLREVSLEASSVKEDESLVATEPKTIEISSKKNKSLQPTNVKAMNCTTPPSTEGSLRGTSPPSGSKLRQIRRRVKDLSWQEIKDQQDHGPKTAVALEDKGDEEDTSKSLSATSDSDKDERPRSPVTVLDKSPVGPLDENAATGEVVSTGEDATVTSKEDINKSPASSVVVLPADPEVCHGKRRREDGGQSPREAKRITPPKSLSARSDSDKDERPRSPVTVLDKSPVGPIDENAATVEVVSTGEDAPLSTVTSKEDIEKSPASSVVVLPADPEVCHGKRRREDGDQSPREAKRITPPPEKEKAEMRPAVTKPSGFMAYAGTVSPFATASNGPNIFGTTGSKPTFGLSTAPKPQLPSTFSSAPSSVSSTPSVVFGSSGFSAYASISSPFAAAKPTAGPAFGATSSPGSKSPSRPESPVRHVNAFGPYTSRPSRFAAAPKLLPSRKPKRGSDGALGGTATGSGSASGSGDEAEASPGPTSAASFGEILSAKDSQPEDPDDESDRVHFTEQEVLTGEEGEYTEFQVRAKLFQLIPAPTSTWRERGVGILKLNVNEKTGRARLLLRNDGVLRLVLNTGLFKGMDFGLGPDPRYVKFGLIVDKKIVLHTLRLGSAKQAADLLAHVREHIPGVEDEKASEDV